MGERRDGFVHGPRRRRAPAVLLGGVLLLILVIGSAGAASAHAVLRSATPADGTVLKTAPEYVTLTFTESVGLLDGSFRVYDPANHRVDTGEPEHAPGRVDTARVRLPGGLGTGTFTVAWRVVSADSHPVAGAFTYSVGKPSPATAPVTAGPTENPLTRGLHDIARYAAYLAAALLLGTLAFVALCRPPAPSVLRGPVLAGWGVLCAATVALLVLRGPYEQGTGPGGALDPDSLARTATGRPGLLLLARLALLLGAAAAVEAVPRRSGGRDPGPAAEGRGPGPAAVRVERGAGLLLARLNRRPGPVVGTAGVVLAVVLSLTWAAADHAAAGIQVPPAMTSSVLHLLAMSAWLGGLCALLLTLRRAPALPAEVVTRFSRLAFGSVTVLVVTGVYQSWRGLGSWHALTGTPYGRLLGAKILAVTLLLAAAGRSRRWTARLAAAGTAVGTAAPDAQGSRRIRIPLPVPGPAVRSGGDVAADPAPLATPQEEPSRDPGGPARSALRRSVLAEVVVAVVVLGITTVLTGTEPGRAATEAGAAASSGGADARDAGIPGASVTTVPFRVGAASGRVQITLDPGRVGRNSVQAVVLGADGGFAAVPELRLSFTLSDRRIGPIDAKVTDRGGYWRSDTLNLPMAGTWTMRTTVRVSDLDQVTMVKRVRVSP